MSEYRITYIIERRPGNETDFTEIGFGSSTIAATVDDALYYIQSDIQNRQWETTARMPEPKDIDR